MKNRILLIVLISSLIINWLGAQQLSVEDLLLEPSALLQGELQAGGNSVFQEIEGNENILNIKQIQQGGLELNLIRTLQIGDQNAAFLEQVGTGNQIVLIQNGNGNLYTMLQEGINNGSVVIQNGNDNVITQQLTHASNVYTEFVQNGNGNEIIHMIEGFSSQSFTIHQNGDGMKAVIVQSNY